MRIAEKRDATRHNAPPSVKATSGIRTLDLRFTKAPPENVNSLSSYSCKLASENPSTIPSSQAQQTGQTDAQSTAIERELAKLADVDRDAMTRHVIALATMSKKRRHAILTLTEEEA